jgi:hypothetical protein
VVYQVSQHTTGRWVALKVLRKQDPRALEEFRREAEFTANLGHGSVRQVYDASQTPDGYPFLAMQFVDTSLRQLLRARQEQGRTFSQQEVARTLVERVRTARSRAVSGRRKGLGRGLLIPAIAVPLVLFLGMALIALPILKATPTPTNTPTTTSLPTSTTRPTLTPSPAPTQTLAPTATRRPTSTPKRPPPTQPPTSASSAKGDTYVQ